MSVLDKLKQERIRGLCNTSPVYKYDKKKCHNCFYYFYCEAVEDVRREITKEFIIFEEKARGVMFKSRAWKGFKKRLAGEQE